MPEAAERLEAKPRRRWAVRVGLCVGSLVASLLLAEIVVRSFYIGEVRVEEAMAWSLNLTRPSASAELIYELKPEMDINVKEYGHHVVTDADGARVSPSDKPPGRPDLKIALVGDSSPFGWWVNYEDTYGELLRRMLETRTGKSIQLRNFCVPGYNSQHNRIALAEKVLPWKPDLVILHYDHNDADPINNRPDWLIAADYGDNFLHSALIKFALRRLKQARNRRHITVASDDPDNPNKVYHDYRYAGPQFDRHLKELEQTAELCKAHSVPIVAFLFNTWLERHDDPEQDPFFTLLHQPMRQRLAEMGFVVIDTYEPSQQIMAQQGWKNLEPHWLSPTDAHPNRAGHRFLANILYEELPKPNRFAEMFPESGKPVPAR